MPLLTADPVTVLPGQAGTHSQPAKLNIRSRSAGLPCLRQPIRSAARNCRRGHTTRPGDAMSKSTDHDEDEGEFINAEEYLQHVLMNETKAYFDRGRRFEKLDVAQLNEKWVVVFKVYFADHTRQQGLDG